MTAFCIPSAKLRSEVASPKQLAQETCAATRRSEDTSDLVASEIHASTMNHEQ
jgi:hypothetical protein